MSKADRWQQYVAEKKRLERIGLSPEEYEKAVKEIAKRIGV